MENTRVQQTSRTEESLNIYWPGTKVYKSRHNAFNWEGQPSKVMQHMDMKIANINKLQKVSLSKKP